MTETENNQSQGVYFLSLTVENVRCFAEKQTLDLSDGDGRPAQWTVILGDNGVGKSTLLDLFSDIKYNGYTRPLIFIRTNSYNSEFILNYGFSSKLEGKVSYLESYRLNVDKSNKLFTGIYKDDDIKIKKLQGLAIYIYSASRYFDKKNETSFGGDNTETLIYDPDKLINAEKWFLQTDYIANKPSEIKEKYTQRLKIIKDTLINLLPDISDIRIPTPSESSPNPKVEFETPDGWLRLSQLSLGYQTMTAWMVDLAAQLFKHYPNSPNPIEEPAVVLIDEIDLHLHPKWQRTIMSYLSERFINTQFIVTAHSPLIVQAAENANIVVLKREGDSVKIHQHPQDVKGWRVDQLLTSDLFDLPSARSPHIENLLQQRQHILSQPQLSDGDQNRLSELENQIGDLPTAETLQDMQAMDIIRRAAELLKQNA